MLKVVAPALCYLHNNLDLRPDAVILQAYHVAQLLWTHAHVCYAGAAFPSYEAR